MKIRMIGLLIFLLVVGGAIWAGAEWTAFINPAGIVFVLITAVGLALMKYRAGTGKAEFIKNLKRYSIPVGVMGCLIGLIQIGWCLSDPANLGIALATAVLTIFYGLILYCVCDALEKTDV